MPNKRITIVPVRYSDDELEVIDALATKLGLTRAATIRFASIKEAVANGVPPPQKKTKNR